MNILVVGSGAREHALGYKLEQSPKVDNVFHYPGNGGTFNQRARAVFPKGVKQPSSNEFVYLATQQSTIDLVVVGPENYLAEGLVDYLEERNVKVFGPTKKSALIETDKFFSYGVMEKLGIPQAKGVRCLQPQDYLDIPEVFPKGCVVKARGLVGGKGVVVCDTLEEVDQATEDIYRLSGSPHILFSEKLEGPEFSVFAICDGENALCFDYTFQDHKRLQDGDQGPNTGGMGAYGPAPIPLEAIRQTHEYMRKVVREINFKGFLFAGMMLTSKGPVCLEFNARMGDPECQVAMGLLHNDLAELLWDAVNGNLDPDCLVRFHYGHGVCVVLTSPGYPFGEMPSLPISGVPMNTPQVNTHTYVFQGATKPTPDGLGVQSDGGRILSVTSFSKDLGDSLKEARDRAYHAITSLEMPGGFHFRKDIGKN